MCDIFISYSEPDLKLAQVVASGLEGTGYTTWYYQRDNVPGEVYLVQIGKSIDESRAVVLIVSEHSLVSQQVTAEVVRAYEEGKPFIPLLHGVTYKELKQRRPEWRQALVLSTSLPIPPAGMDVVLPRIVQGLEQLGISPAAQSSSSIDERIDKKRHVRKWLINAVSMLFVVVILGIGGLIYYREFLMDRGTIAVLSNDPTGTVELGWSVALRSQRYRVFIPTTIEAERREVGDVISAKADTQSLLQLARRLKVRRILFGAAQTKTERTSTLVLAKAELGFCLYDSVDNRIVAGSRQHAVDDVKPERDVLERLSGTVIEDVLDSLHWLDRLAWP